MSMTHAFAPITKREKDPETGYLTVYGKLTGTGLDLDQQRMDPTWLATAIPEWFTSGANIREMHQPKAVGKGMALEQDGDDWYLTSVIVDRDAIAKIEADVLTGYSIGIKAPVVTHKSAQAPNGVFTGGKVVESSVVDRPCLPDAKFMVAKMAKSGVLEPVAEWAKKPAEPESELVTAAKGVLADLEGLVPDLTKADDEASDIASAMDAIKMIARLIQSEAQGLAAGQMTEAGDISALLEAVSALRWFMEREALEPELSEEDMNMDSLIGLGVSADIVKAATADTASDDDRAALRAEAVKALGLDTLGADIAKTVADTITKQLEADMDATKAAATKEADGLRERLAKVEAMAAPGGPIRARTAEQSNKAAEADRTRQEITHLRTMAATVNDPHAAAGYRQMVAEREARLNTPA